MLYLLKVPDKIWLDEKRIALENLGWKVNFGLFNIKKFSNDELAARVKFFSEISEDSELFPILEENYTDVISVESIDLKIMSEASLFGPESSKTLIKKTLPELPHDFKILVIKPAKTECKLFEESNLNYVMSLNDTAETTVNSQIVDFLNLHASLIVLSTDEVLQKYKKTLHPTSGNPNEENIQVDKKQSLKYFPMLVAISDESIGLTQILDLCWQQAYEAVLTQSQMHFTLYTNGNAVKIIKSETQLYTALIQQYQLTHLYKPPFTCGETTFNQLIAEYRSDENRVSNKFQTMLLKSYSNKDVIFKEQNFLISSLHTYDTSFSIKVFHSPKASSTKYPAMVFLTGNGNIRTVHGICTDIAKALAIKTKRSIIMVQNLLAPEHQYPAPLFDILSLVDFIRHNTDELMIDKENIVWVAYSSEGSALLQLATYPVFNFLQDVIKQMVLIAPQIEFRNQLQDLAFQNERFFGRELIAWLWNNYFPKDTNLASPHISVTQAKRFYGQNFTIISGPKDYGAATHEDIANTHSQFSHKIVGLDHMGFWESCEIIDEVAKVLSVSNTIKPSTSSAGLFFMKSLPQSVKFAIIGTGFWAKYQLASWREVFKQLGIAQVEIYLCDIDSERLSKFAEEQGISSDHCYTDVSKLIFFVKDLTFIDIIASNVAHYDLVMQLASYRIPLICQKPLANSLNEAEKMLQTCKQHNTKLFVHENWRFQTPIRKLHDIFEKNSKQLGKPNKAEISYCNTFPVFQNQPALKELDKFIVMDMGTHILDVARYLFGEAKVRKAILNQSRPDIKGEDDVQIELSTALCSNVTVEISYAKNIEPFPQTQIYIECENGTIQLINGNKIYLRVGQKEEQINVDLPNYNWVEPDYALVQSAMPACQNNIIHSILQEHPSEVTAEENIKTLQLVFECYSNRESHTLNRFRNSR